MTSHQRGTLVVALVALAAASGCAGQKETIAYQQAAIDSVKAVTLSLQGELRSARDSLAFLRDIDSGQYYRDRRILHQEIEQLQYNVALCVDGGRTIETLLVDDLFAPASAQLTDAGRARLQRLGERIGAEFEGRTLRVEGHSDATPIGPTLLERYPSNWELSADRSAAVVRYLVEEGGLASENVVLAAYGSARPVARNDVAEGRAQNRRIRISALPR